MSYHNICFRGEIDKNMNLLFIKSDNLEIRGQVNK